MRRLLDRAGHGRRAALGGARPAAPPDYPVNFIKVDELKALLDSGTQVDVIDVRTWDAVPGAAHQGRALDAAPGRRRARASEISKTGPSSSTEPARTRWPGGPATSCTRSGWRNQRVLDEGLPGWHAKGYPVEGTNATPASRALTGVTGRRRARPRGARGARVARAAAGRAARSRSSPPPTRSLLARLNYTSHIPCNGVEEPKSRRVLRPRHPGRLRRRRTAPLLGFGSEPSDLEPARRRARARQGAPRRGRRSGVRLAARALGRAARRSSTTTTPR